MLTNITEIIESIKQMVGVTPKFSQLSIIPKSEFVDKFGMPMDDLFGGTAAITTTKKEIFVREDHADSVIHELVHTAGMHDETISEFINEGVVQLVAESIGNKLGVHVRSGYSENVNYVRDVLNLLGETIESFVHGYAKSQDKAVYLCNKIMSKYDFKNTDDWGNNVKNNMINTFKKSIGPDVYIENLKKINNKAYLRLSKRIIASIYDDSKKKFGITTDLSVAGYILPDGTLLDLSGRLENGDPYIRQRDHREAGRGGTAGMREFMKDGAIRVFPEHGGLDIVKCPTDAQFQQIIRFANLFRGELILDLSNGIGKFDSDNDMYVQDGGHSMEYPIGTARNRIIMDIKKYYGRK